MLQKYVGNKREDFLSDPSPSGAALGSRSAARTVEAFGFQCTKYSVDKMVRILSTLASRFLGLYKTKKFY